MYVHGSLVGLGPLWRRRFTTPGYRRDQRRWGLDAIWRWQDILSWQDLTWTYPRGQRMLCIALHWINILPSWVINKLPLLSGRPANYPAWQGCTNDWRVDGRWTSGSCRAAKQLWHEDTARENGVDEGSHKELQQRASQGYSHSHGQWRTGRTMTRNCWNCGKVGHLLRECLSPKTTQQQGKKNPPTLWAKRRRRDHRFVWVR